MVIIEQIGRWGDPLETVTVPLHPLFDSFRIRFEPDHKELAPLPPAFSTRKVKVSERRAPEAIR